MLIIHVWMTTIMSTGLLGWMGYEVAIFLCIITNIDLVREQARKASCRAKASSLVSPFPAAETANCWIELATVLISLLYN